MSEIVVTTTADTANPTMVPATPKREVKMAAKGEATAPATTLGRSMSCC
jgi:hypothetical protein